MSSFSDYRGVTYSQRDQKWRAQIRYNYRRINLGEFNTEKEAAIAYNRAALRYFGEFAALNEVI